jgi:hypothetical protein
VLGLLAGKELTDEQEDAVKTTLIDRPFRDIFYWHSKQPRIIFKDGREMPIDVEAIKKRRVQRLEECLLNTNRLTGVGLTADELDFVQRHWQLLDRLLPKDESHYARGRNPTPFNLILQHDLGTLTKDNFDTLLQKFMKPENVWNIDTEVSSGYKHSTEDFVDYADAYDLHHLKFRSSLPLFGGDLQTFGRGSTRGMHKYLAEVFGYDTPLADHSTLAFFRLLRLREYTIDTYVRRLIGTRGNHPSYHEDLGILIQHRR